MPKSASKSVSAKASRALAQSSSKKAGPKSGKLLLFGLAAVLGFVAYRRRQQQARPPVEVVAQLELDQLDGSWYEIARLPNAFQKADWTAGKEHYSLNPDGSFDVTYTYQPGSLSAPQKSIQAKLWRPLEFAPTGHLKYRPFWPVAAGYLVLDISADYLVVGTSDRKMLWILARQPELPQDVYQALIQRAVYQGYNVSRLMLVPQPAAGPVRAQQVKA